jgi:hypothetical protein
MPPEDGAPTTPATTEPVATGTDIAASLATAPDASTEAPPAGTVLDSPEYQALQEQNRVLARQAGTQRAEADRLRAEEVARVEAAEAERVANIQQQMGAALGDQAQAFSDYATLLQTDPVQAAQKFAEMSKVQSPTPLEPTTPAVPVEAPQVPVTPQAPQPPTLGVSASTPLGQTQQQSQDDATAALDKEVEAVVEANQGLSTRARVTDRIRATAMGKYMQSAYTKEMAGETPDLDLNQRRR